jgi:hypothetical protein
MKDLQRAPSTGEVQSPEQLEERIQQRAYELRIARKSERPQPGGLATGGIRTH